MEPIALPVNSLGKLYSGEGLWEGVGNPLESLALFKLCEIDYSLPLTVFPQRFWRLLRTQKIFFGQI